MAITQNDLHNLKNEIKLEVSKEQTDLRHEDRKKLSDCIWKVDDLDKKSAVNDNILKTMSDNFKEMKEMMNNISDKIDGFQNKFASKEEHKENVTRLSVVEKGIAGINLKIAGVSGGFAVIIFLIDKYAGK